MKTILILLFSFVFVSSCVTSGVKTRAVASEKCNIDNYKDFINKPGVHRCDLQGADLQEANFERENLEGANFEDADLEKADLQYANLEGAIFTDASLKWADFLGANLRGADFRGANLRGASFIGADLYKADLRGANLKRIWFDKDTNLRKAIVTKEQAEYLRSKGLYGNFIIMEQESSFSWRN